MNKEKIEKAKCHLEWLLDNGILASEDEPHIENILKYIQHLEQKSETLDKVTDKLKEDIVEAKEKIKYWEEQYRISKAKKDEFYKNSYKRQINRWQSRFETLREILNIIEGEK